MASFNNDQLIDLLKVEYVRLTTEQHIYIQQYTPTLNVFGTTVLMGFAFAFAKKGYEAIYVILPFVVFMIAIIGMGQAHMLASLGIRIREIEKQIMRLNSGVAVFEWEHKYAQCLVFPPMIKLIKKDNTKPTIFPSPLFLTVCIMVLGGILLNAYSSYKACEYINHTFPGYWGYAYIGMITIFTVALGFQSFGFFIMGHLVEKVDMDASLKDSLKKSIELAVPPNRK